MPRTDSKPKKAGDHFPVVGIGASAGGLEAMIQLLRPMPADSGMAFVLVQHLDPSHESALGSLLSKVTKMPVAEARNNVKVERDRVYVIPPNKKMVLSGGRLKLSPMAHHGTPDYSPVDHFLMSVAETEGTKGIGIILSGTGSDGTQGLLAIKAAGGITFAQDEKSAKFHGMPSSAIAAGCVDFVLPPDKMVRELKRLPGQMSAVLAGTAPEVQEPAIDKAFAEILTLVRQRSGVDFTHYKHATLRRRLQRRMVLHKVGSIGHYLKYLRTHPAEVKELFNDILIHVTGFFRDPAVFAALRKKVFPKLLKRKAPQEPVRIWIPGCSTGEEVYSIAISLVELMNERRQHHPVQIFATDINELTLEKARAGLYPESAVSDIPPERLRRFFVKTDRGYRVNRTIRELCVFARQNLVNDPPFSNLDLISCRNVLIYLGPTLQRKVMPVFHYALRPGGLLMLGASETIGGFSDLFSLFDKKAKIYTKMASQARVSVSFGHTVPELAESGEKEPPPSLPVTAGISEIQKQADRIVLTSYSLPGVVINANLDVLQFRGRTGMFLEHSHGEATLNLLKMAREGLMPELRAALARTIKQDTRVRQEGLRVRQNGHFIECNVEIIPFMVPAGQEKFYLVLFEAATPLPPEPGKGKVIKTNPQKTADGAELAHLREELSATRESLQAIIEEQEATNEELRSANEEIMSSNEELQSTNEELETAKEELQSTNEELTTLNDELESRNGELEQVNNDLHNLLASVNIPVVILGADLRIRRFTAIAGKLFKLIPGDVGRPITDIAMPLEIPARGRQVLDVFESLTPKDMDVQDKQGHWWSVRIRPYKTTDHKIDGAVIALLDIDVIKTRADSAQVLDVIFKVVRQPMVALGKDRSVRLANRQFLDLFKLKPDEIIGRSIYDLENKGWESPALHRLLDQRLERYKSCDAYKLEHEFPGAGLLKLSVNARRLIMEEGGEATVVLSFETV